MDAETIQEIANQLGITVDEVTKEAIPAFAQFEIGHNIFGVIMFGCLFAVTLALTVFFVLSVNAISSVTLWIYSPYGSFINYILN